MDNQPLVPCYPSLSHRVALSYLRSLAPLPAAAEGEDAIQLAQRDLHEFFHVLYQKLYEDPFLFGMPAAEDMWIDESGPEHIDKQEINRKLAKPREVMELGLAFLMEAGKEGILAGDGLVIEDYVASLKKPKVVLKFLKGAQAAGLQIIEQGRSAILTHPRFPRMMSALQALAQSCAAYKDARMGQFNFARCDFRALVKDTLPDPLDLYQVLNPPDAARAVELHHYFISKGYKAEVEGHGVSAWVVKYQGSRKIKSTPLFQVEFQERFLNPMRMAIKPVSTSRITPIINQQSQTLQDDFFRRKNLCQGSKCDWCKNSKSLGPTVLDYKGEQYTICWYTNSDIREITPDTVELIKQYAVMHDQLA